MGSAPRLTAAQVTPCSRRKRSVSVGVVVPGGWKSAEQTATSMYGSRSWVPGFQLPPSKRVLRPRARAERAAATARSMWWPSNSTRSQSVTSASRSSGGVRRCAVALVEATARSPVDAVTRTEETAGGSGESAARSETVTPSAARSATTPTPNGWAPIAVRSRGVPPRWAKVTAALAAGPPAATTCCRAVSFSFAPGAWSTSWMTSRVHSPTNSPVGRPLSTYDLLTPFTNNWLSSPD